MDKHAELNYSEKKTAGGIRLSGESAYCRNGYTNDGFKFVDLEGGPFLCVSGELYDIPGEIQSIDPDPDEAGALLISVS